MVEKVKRYISRHCPQLIPDGLHLVGVSGGADSVCLLLVLQELGYHVHAIHCNFRLRGEESDRDERFVKELCQGHDIALSIAHFDTREYASLHKVSIEMAARELRYGYFNQLLKDLQASTVCVAHHRDDSAETVLMNLLRGTGIEGLAGIKAEQGHIVRPLLCLSRKEIEQWLDSRRQDYVTDSSNLVADVLRNQLRLKVIPLLEEIHPGASANIVRSSEWAAEALSVYQDAMQKALTGLIRNDSIGIDELHRQPSPESILFEWLHPLGFSSAAIANIFHTDFEQGQQWLSATHQLTYHQGRLMVTPRQQERPTLRIPETGRYVYDEQATFSVKLVEERMISRDATTATFDADKVTMPLTIRPVEQGDRFQPFGMTKGTKLVSDFLTDCKMPLPEKQRQLVVTDAQGAIVWLVGLRTDQRFCVDDSTVRTMVVTS